MPAEGMTWLPRDEVLTFEELERVARLLVERHGVDSIRLTSGEPTVRAHLPVLVGKLAALPVDLALTTNGATLRLCASDQPPRPPPEPASFRRSHDHRRTEERRVGTECVRTCRSRGGPDH